MNFTSQNAIDLYTIIAVLIAIIGLVFLMKLDKNKKWIGKLPEITKSFKMFGLILNVLPISDRSKNETQFVYDVANEVLEYINKLDDANLNKEGKMVISSEIVSKILAKLKKTPNQDQLKLIDLVIKEGIELSERT